jgi:hypothetical protein
MVMKLLLRFSDGNYMILPSQAINNGATVATFIEILNPFTGQVEKLFWNQFHKFKKTILFGGQENGTK